MDVWHTQSMCMPAPCWMQAGLLTVRHVLHSPAHERVQAGKAGNRLLVQEYNRGAHGRSCTLVCHSAEAPENRLLQLRRMEEQLYTQLSTAIIGPTVLPI